jgi:E3 ubiquitin-protein ligase EDD1
MTGSLDNSINKMPTFVLFCRISIETSIIIPQMLDTLLTTLIREIQTEARKVEAKVAAHRFVRSVARIFVVLNAEMAPQSTKKKSYVFSVNSLLS